MSPVATRRAPPRPVNRNRMIVALIAALLAALMALSAPLLDLPAQIDEITVRNLHPWTAHVTVSDEARNGWLSLGSVPRETQRTFHQIIDQGDAWIFSFSYAGERVEVPIDRDSLERQGWTITVPDELAQRLRAADVFETPPDTG